jgi:hypothetical protein
MGGCLSASPVPLLPYEPAPATAHAPPHRRRHSWSAARDAGGNGGSGSGRKKSQRDKVRDGGGGGGERERERSRSRSKQGSKSAAAASSTHAPPLATPSSQAAPMRSHSVELSASWKDGAAAVTASFASELQADEQELEDWQRGMIDILEEQSIQAYDMDMSMGPNLERRYSNSLMGFPSTNGMFDVSAADAARGMMLAYAAPDFIHRYHHSRRRCCVSCPL